MYHLPITSRHRCAWSQDPAKPATIDNLVLLTHAEADEHDELQNLDALRQQVRSSKGGRRCSGRGGAEVQRGHGDCGRPHYPAEPGGVGTLFCTSCTARATAALLANRPATTPPSCSSHRPSQEPELCARVEATLARAKRDFWWRI